MCIVKTGRISTYWSSFDVLIIAEHTPRSQWPLGLVTEVFKGSDSVVRPVKVCHLTVAKLFLLELDAEEEEYASTDGRMPDGVPHQELEAASQAPVTAPGVR